LWMQRVRWHRRDYILNKLYSQDRKRGRASGIIKRDSRSENHRETKTIEKHQTITSPALASPKRDGKLKMPLQGKTNGPGDRLPIPAAR
jgi:hypothetical protein